VEEAATGKGKEDPGGQEREAEENDGEEEVSKRSERALVKTGYKRATLLTLIFQSNLEMLLARFILLGAALRVQRR